MNLLFLLILLTVLFFLLLVFYFLFVLNKVLKNLHLQIVHYIYLHITCLFSFISLIFFSKIRISFLTLNLSLIILSFDVFAILVYFSSLKNSLHLFLICSITKLVTFSKLLLCGVHNPKCVFVA